MDLTEEQLKQLSSPSHDAVVKQPAAPVAEVGDDDFDEPLGQACQLGDENCESCQ